MIRAWVGVYLEKVDIKRIVPDSVDWLLCHYSARSLREAKLDLIRRGGHFIKPYYWGPFELFTVSP